MRADGCAARILAVAVALVAATPAQDQTDVTRLELRVVSSGGGGPVVVDRGTRDQVVAGDLVFFFPRDGSVIRGSVVQLAERSAVVELHEKGIVPEPGTKGEVWLPNARLQRPAPKAAAEHPPWQNPDQAWSPDMPLLAQVRPQRPESRPARLSGRVWLIAELTGAPEDGGHELSNSLLRAGTALLYENPFGRGGALQLDAEIDYDTEVNDQAGFDLLTRQLSYHEGGTRFDATRWELGRFLHHVMPELGVLDGLEWSQRRDNGHRFGASVGYLPELNDDFESFEDFQLAAFYEWVVDPRGATTLAAGFQKSWHEGSPDRDLLVLDGRSLPGDGWDLQANAWIDFYHGRDDIKGSGIEVTQALVSAGRRMPSGNGFDLSYRHQRFPEMLRQEFQPLPANELADNRLDRLAGSGWIWSGTAARLHGQASAFDDEDGTGGALDLGLERQQLFGAGGRGDVTLFGTAAPTESVLGARLSYGVLGEDRRWDAYYEISHHHQLGFPDDADDLFQHRFGVSHGFWTATGWNASFHADTVVWDTEVSWSLGCQVERSF